MVALPEQAVQCEVQTVGSVEREDDPFRPLGAEQSSGAFATTRDHVVHTLGGARVAASLGGSFFAQRALDSFRHRGGFG